MSAEKLCAACSALVALLLVRMARRRAQEKKLLAITKLRQLRPKHHAQSTPDAAEIADGVRKSQRRLEALRLPRHFWSSSPCSVRTNLGEPAAPAAGG